jgi:drug/metabolite transporter (DMT)-like permease
MKFILIIFNIVCLVFGQTAWKMGLEKVELHGSVIAKFFQIVFSPLILLGFALYIIATVVWMYLLSKFPMSYLYPLQSLAYIISLFVGLFVFKEIIPVTRWIGTIVILFGVYLIVK